MTTEANRQKYVDKIAALLRKAEGTENQAEAEAFFGKAQELMTKWAIDDAELAQHQGRDSKDEIAKEVFIIQMAFYMEDAMVLQAAALPNNCRVLVTGDKKTALKGQGKGERIAYLVGFDSDRARVKMLYTSLQLQMAKAMHADLRDAGVTYMERSEKKRYRASYRIGFAQALRLRLEKSKEETVQASAPGTGLVLADRGAQVDRYMGPTKARKGRGRNLDGGAMASGAAAARRADIGNPSVRGGAAGALR